MSYSFFFNPDRRHTILCVGDMMLDSFVYGQAVRLSPEAPIPVLKADREEKTLGGSGNVMRNICDLKANVVGLCVVGKDEASRTISDLSHKIEGLTLEAFESDRPTIVKTRFIASNQQLLRVDNEQDIVLEKQTLEAIKNSYKENLLKSSVVVLSDYGKGTLSNDLLRFCIEEANKVNIPVLIDPKGSNYSKYKGATLLSPNLKEFQQACGKNVTSTKEIIEEAKHLLSELNVKALLVTRGKEGMTLVTKEGSTSVQALAQEVFDVSGAGDTVIATLAVALSRGGDLVSSMELSNVAASVVVSKVGTATLTPQELLEALDQQQYRTTHQKMMSAEKLLDWRLKCKRQGLTVGFTNGCFDLLHLGHLHTFKEAKKHCDKLIVALNTDDSIKRLKGDSRPIQTQDVRAEVLSALTLVDGVILFDHNTPLELIKQLEPDFLFKGADYTLEQVVGAKEVMAYGGKVHLISLKEGFSTTRTVHKILTEKVA